MGDSVIGDMFVLKECNVGHSFRVRLLDSADMGTVVVRRGV